MPSFRLLRGLSLLSIHSMIRNFVPSTIQQIFQIKYKYTCSWYSADYSSQTNSQNCYAISEGAADW